jgi:hypothetical protein
LGGAIRNCIPDALLIPAINKAVSSFREQTPESYTLRQVQLPGICRFSATNIKKAGDHAGL